MEQSKSILKSKHVVAMSIRYNYRNSIVDGADILKNLNSGLHYGLIENMPSKRYHELSSYFSSSDLKSIYKSSLFHFNFKRNNGLDSLSSQAAVLGSLVHCFVGTPDEFGEEFYAVQKTDRRTKAGMAAYAEAMLECGTRQLVDSELVLKAKVIAKSVMSSDVVSKLMEQAQCELSYFWKCPFSSLNFRARCDGLSAGRLIELKTTSALGPKDFERQAFNLSYDLSAYHYIEGLRSSLGIEVTEFYFIVVETESPFAVQVYMANESFLASGHSKWLEVVTKLEKAKASNVWPSYAEENEVLPLSAPRWAQPKVEISSEEESEDLF